MGQADFEGCLAVVHVSGRLSNTRCHLPFDWENQIARASRACCSSAHRQERLRVSEAFPCLWGFAITNSCLPSPSSSGKARPASTCTFTGCSATSGPGSGSVTITTVSTKASLGSIGIERRFLASDASHAPIFCADVRRLQRAPAGALAWIQAAATLSVIGRRSDRNNRELSLRLGFRSRCNRRRCAGRTPRRRSSSRCSASIGGRGTRTPTRFKECVGASVGRIGHLQTATKPNQFPTCEPVVSRRTPLSESYNAREETLVFINETKILSCRMGADGEILKHHLDGPRSSLRSLHQEPLTSTAFLHCRLAELAK